MARPKGSKDSKPKTHCKRGHEFTEENTRIRKNGARNCRKCVRVGDKRRSPRYLESRKPAKRAWLKKNPKSAAQTHKKAWVKSKYGLSLAEYDSILLSQNNLCALCKRPFEGIGSLGLAPALDHCHVTGKNREFLHSMCNKGLGHFNDDPVMLRLAAEYLEKHQGGISGRI